MDNLIMPDNRHPRADAVKNRALLLQTARRLFREIGVADVTMSAIAQEAQVGKGTLYRHFADKSELCVALLDEDQRDLQARTFLRLQTDGNPRDKLHWFLEEVVTFIEANFALLCEASNHASVSMLAHPAHAWWRQTISALMGQCGFRGDLSYASDVLYVLLDVQTLQFQRNALGYDVERIIRGLRSTADRLLGVDESG